MSAAAPWTAYAGQEEQGPWAKYAGKPGATTANNSVENAAPKLEGSSLERGVSGAISGAKALLPDLHPGHMLESAIDTASGAAVPRAIGSAYQNYQENRKIGQGVIPSAASAIGSMVGLDSPGIRDRAARGDVAGVVGEAVPAVAGIILGGELADARTGIARRMYTPTGELTPGAEALTHPTQLPEYIGRKMFPEPEEQVARREADEFYNQKGSDLMRRQREQDALDRKAQKIGAGGGTGIPQIGEGSLANTRSRIVKSPSEFLAQDQLDPIIKENASRRGTAFAGGFVPEGGRKIGARVRPTPFEDFEYPQPRGQLRWNPETNAWEP